MTRKGNSNDLGKGVQGENLEKHTPLKIKKKGIFLMKNLTPMRAIRKKCLDCCAFQPKEVTLCTAEKCPLYPYRMGKRPNPSNNEKTAATAAK